MTDSFIPPAREVPKQNDARAWVDSASRDRAAWVMGTCPVGTKRAGSAPARAPQISLVVLPDLDLAALRLGPLEVTLEEEPERRTQAPAPEM
jgi:hypothetical protein